VGVLALLTMTILLVVLFNLSFLEVLLLFIGVTCSTGDSFCTLIIGELFLVDL
jgi:hypothetical protein